MAFSSSLPSIPEKYKNLVSSFFSSPKLFANFTSKVLCETEAVLSPTSILDSKPSSGLKNPFWSETNSPRTPVGEHKRYWDKLDSKGLVDALVDDNKPGEMTSKSQSRIILFGSQLKIQNPPLPHAALSPSSQSPKTAFECTNSGLQPSKSPTPRVSHGPNPRTTHIFDNCIVESGCFDVGSSSSPIENVFLPSHTSYHSESFMSLCFYCKKNLAQDMDIYMYRGERAFCSLECRDQGMLLESKLEAGDVYGT